MFGRYSLYNVARVVGFSLGLGAATLLSGCDTALHNEDVSRVTDPIRVNLEIRLTDLQGNSIDPFEIHQAKAIVFLFLRTNCPIANRYAPEVRRLHRRFAPRGVAFWLVYPDEEEAAESIAEHLDRFEYSCQALRDPQRTLVRLTHVTVTPEVAVFLPGGELVYRGRIDNRYVDFGKARFAATERDLEAVLNLAIAGGPVPRRTTTAIGCPIPDVP